MNRPEPDRASAPPTLILAGPTGVGKTQLAVDLALRRDLELISADSMQVYRGLEIGTAQPTPAELRGVPMHGCGVLDPDEPFSVKRFLDLCDGWRRRIVERGRRPLYVGGTGLYLRALRWGLFEEPPIDPRLRDRLNDELQREGAVAMHERLARLDPALALKVPAADGVRIVRALEIAEGSGRPLSELQTQWLDPRPRFDRELLVLTCPRERLVERIERRIDAMFAAGWVAEVGRLLEAGRSPELHCFKALGYREIVALLRGEVDEATTRKRIEARTRQFAKRQMTWLRAERDARWIEYDGRSPESALPEIEKLLDARRSLS